MERLDLSFVKRINTFYIYKKRKYLKPKLIKTIEYEERDTTRLLVEKYCLNKNITFSINNKL